MTAAIYCRLSEEDRNKQSETDDSTSIQNQKAMLIQYAAEQGWEIYDIYSDDDYTGSDRRRPAFNRLLRDAEAGKFDVVLCKTQSRFTRELELVEKYIHGLFPLWGIRFVSIVDNADTANKGNKKSRQINGLVNEWYLEDMSDNIRSVLTNRRENGFHIGAFALYGYKKDPDQKGHLIIDEEAAAVVREVFSLFAQGYGKTAIARHLNDRGIPNPTEYKRQHGLRYKQPAGKNSTLWKYFAIADMLENEIYIGNMVQGKYESISYKTKQTRPRPKSEWYVVEGTHEPIIDRDLWDRVQTLVKVRSKAFRNGTTSIFARKVRCANCGYVMRSCKSAPERGGRHYLKCSSRHVAKDACIGAFISFDRLEKTIIQELNKLADRLLLPDEIEANVEFCSHLQAKRSELLSFLESQNKKMEGFATGIRDLYMDKVKGVLDEENFILLSRDLSVQKEALTTAIAETEKELSVIDERLAVGDNRKELVMQYVHPEHLTREMMDVLIDYIEVGKRLSGSHETPVKIHWNF